MRLVSRSRSFGRERQMTTAEVKLLSLPRVLRRAERRRTSARSSRAQRRPCMQVSGAERPASMAFRGPGPPISIPLFLLDLRTRGAGLRFCG
jgi:hypothetical protein